MARVKPIPQRRDVIAQRQEARFTRAAPVSGEARFTRATPPKQQMTFGERQMWDIAKQTYPTTGAAYAGNNEYRLVRSTPTLKIYKRVGDFNDYVVAARGTASVGDIFTDAALVFGALRHTPRYRGDREELARFLAATPGANLTFTGHSLGGAVARELAKEFAGHGGGGVTFNSAFDLTQLRDDTSGLKNLYATGDPLGVLALASSGADNRVLPTNHFDPLGPIGQHRLSTFNR
jgi:hypothetical protein